MRDISVGPVRLLELTGPLWKEVGILEILQAIARQERKHHKSIVLRRSVILIGLRAISLKRGMSCISWGRVN